MQQKDSAGPAAAAGRGRKPGPSNRSRQQLQRERALQLAAQRTAESGSAPLPLDQKLTKPPPKDEPQPGAAQGAPSVKQEAPEEEKAEERHRPAAVEETECPVKELEKQEVELREKTRLEQLQQEQKIIEERNKRKKALLAKTIAEKSKQTQAEAVKLKRIQKELQALDDMVSNDIGILRGRIEQASWDYSTARKRYEKAEAEYVAAKLDLHRRTEVKEQLTEHLCAIIQQNELRKAHKLEELMEQLQLQAHEEVEEEEAKQGNGAPANQEEAPHSNKDGTNTDQQTAAKPEADCEKTVENGVQSEAVAS